MCITLWLKQNEFWAEAAWSLNKTRQGRRGEWGGQIWRHGKIERGRKQLERQWERDGAVREVQEERRAGVGGREREREKWRVNLSFRKLYWIELCVRMCSTCWCSCHTHTDKFTHTRTHFHPVTRSLTHLKSARLRFLIKHYCPLLPCWDYIPWCCHDNRGRETWEGTYNTTAHLSLLSLSIRFCVKLLQCCLFRTDQNQLW